MPVFVGDSLLAHAKAGCYRCGRGDRIVDMDVQIVGEGALALCAVCIQEAAEAAHLHLNAGAVAEERAAFAEERRQFSPERVAELEAELAAAQAELQVERQVTARLADAQKPAPARKPAAEKA